MYYDVIAAAAQCRETRQGDTTSEGRHDDLSSLHVTALDQSYFFIRHINFMRYNNIVYSFKVRVLLFDGPIMIFVFIPHLCPGKLWKIEMQQHQLSTLMSFKYIFDDECQLK